MGQVLGQSSTMKFPVFLSLGIAVGIAAGFLSLRAPAADASAPWTQAVMLDHASEQTDRRMRVVMVEAEGCGACQAFRRHVVSDYAASKYAAVAPLDLVDLRSSKFDELKLQGGVGVFPTFLIINAQGRELVREEGWSGDRKAFYRTLGGLLLLAGQT